MRATTLAAGCLAAVAVVTGCSTTNAALPAESASASASSSLVGVTSRINDFGLLAGSGVNTISFAYSGNYTITSSQESTWSGVENCGPTSPCTVVATAGRKNSSQVWDWFKTNAPAWGCSDECDSNNEMNFAFTGTLTINGTAYPVTLGQAGQTVVDIYMDNGWWYGGPGWTGNSNTGIATTPDGKYTLNPMKTNNAQVTVLAVG